jgi:hypothetical protein
LDEEITSPKLSNRQRTFRNPAVSKIVLRGVNQKPDASLNFFQFLRQQLDRIFDSSHSGIEIRCTSPRTRDALWRHAIYRIPGKGAHALGPGFHTGLLQCQVFLVRNAKGNYLVSFSQKVT